MRPARGDCLLQPVECGDHLALQFKCARVARTVDEQHERELSAAAAVAVPRQVGDVIQSPGLGDAAALGGGALSDRLCGTVDAYDRQRGIELTTDLGAVERLQ